jgi:ubiquinone/menaquinone biosynthesis C-methylase UbiE
MALGGSMAHSTKDARFWDKIARKYARDPIGDMAGYERTLEAVARRLAPEHRVLELGCGTGTTALRLAQGVAQYVASDVSAEMIAIAREKAEGAGLPQLTFEVASADAAPGPEGHFDVVLAFNLLHLINDRRAALEGAHRLLKPGGLFISKTPLLKEMNPLIRAAIPLMQALGKAPHVAAFDANELERDLTAVGFTIIERDRHGSGTKDPRAYLAAVRA